MIENIMRLCLVLVLAIGVLTISSQLSAVDDGLDKINDVILAAAQDHFQDKEFRTRWDCK